MPSFSLLLVQFVIACLFSHYTFLSESCCTIGLGTVIIMICDGRDIAYISPTSETAKTTFADLLIDDGAMNVVVRKWIKS